MPVPVKIEPSSVLVNVQFPVAGSLLIVRPPVETEHVGWIRLPTNGDRGAAGELVIEKPAEAGEVHPLEFVTLKLYEPGERSFKTIPAPLLSTAIVPDVLTNVQLPVAGKSKIAMLPVPTKQVGWLTIEPVGAGGSGGAALIANVPVEMQVGLAVLRTRIV